VIAAAQRYYNLSDVRYRTGIDTYLNVFTAETSLLGSQETAITLRLQQITNSIQMIEALGGGWDVQQLPSEKAVAMK
jgi:outer membrane protein TolC